MSEKSEGLSVFNAGALAKPMCKLIDAVKSGLGAWFEPHRIRRKARAQADAMIILAKAESKRQELAQRAAHRLAYQELRRQENIEAILEGAAKSLPDRVSDEPVDPDWISRFFQECQDVSNEQLQELWSHLLAKEVEQPGSCSRRTLSILQGMSPGDAQTYRKACSLVCVVGSAGAIFLPARVDRSGRITAVETLGFEILQEDYDLSYDDLINLDSLGLLHLGTDIGEQLRQGDRFFYAGLEHIVTNEVSPWPSHVRCLPLTSSGLELYRVSSAVLNERYYRAILHTFFQEYDLRVACTIGGPRPQAQGTDEGSA